MHRARISSLSAFLDRLAHNTRGAVAVIGALSLTTIVGMGAFAVEATRGYAADVANQRIADSAALAGALAYNVNSSTSQMTATARAVVVAQGLSASAADVQLVTDAATARQLVQVTVTTAVPLALGRVFTSALSYDVSAVGSATISTTATVAPPCIATLDTNAATGIVLSGGVAISAPGCSINTNGRVDVPWGTTIAAKQVNAGGAVVNPGSGITTSPTANNIFANKASAAADWMSSDPTLKNLLCQVNRVVPTTDPDYPDGNTTCTNPQVLPATLTNSSTEDWTTGYVPLTGVPHIYQTAAYSCQYNIPAGNWNLRNVTISGGCSMNFASGSTIRIANLNMSGNGMTIGDGDLTVSGTFGFNSGSVITIGNGNHSFGSLAVTGGRTLNIGTGNLVVGGAITMDGGSYIFANIGVGNTVTIGNNGSGTAISIGGGSKLCFTAASGTNCSTPTAAAGTFNANGAILSSGGSTIGFPKAATHVIDGSLSLNGSSVFGSGNYIIAGNFTNNTGGTMTGSDVTFALSGTFTLSGGTSLDLAAPNSLSNYGVPGILIATKSTAATTIGGGSANRYAGLIYAPKSNMTISGGGSISANGSACMMMILNRLTLSGGGTASTGSCTSLSGASGPVASVALFK